MKSDGKQFGKQQPKPAELGTENRRTHDAKPRTLNPKLETSDPRGPKLSFWPPAAGIRCQFSGFLGY